MTTNPSIFNQIRDVINDINEQVDSNDIEEPDAEDIIQSMTMEGGGIEVIGDDFDPVHEHVSDVQSRAKGTYERTYGIDGSTTKDLTFNNGLVISIAVATAAVTNSDTVQSISERNTISTTVYFDENEVEVKPESTEKNKVRFDQFPRVTNLNRDLSDWINSISRTDAEGNHFEWVSADIDGPLFIDGPIIPSDILLWSTYYSEGDISRTPMEDWPEKVHEVLQSYVNGVENCVKSDNPVFGVQKTTSSTRVIDALTEKDPDLTRRKIPFTDDGVLFTSALKDESKETTISYTPWYRENEIDVGRSIGRVAPFEGLDDIELSLGQYDDYTREFFYVKAPTQPTVYRIGVPSFFVRSWGRGTLRDIALNEIVKQFKEPLPIVVADQKVRIPKRLRDEFRRLISSEAQKDKNEQRFG